MPRQMVKLYFQVCLSGFSWKALAGDGKVHCPPQGGWISPHPLGAQMEQKGERRTNSLSSWAGCPPSALILQLLVLGPLTSDWDLRHLLPLILRPLDLDRILPLGLLVCQLAHSKLWNFLISITAQANSYNESPLKYIFQKNFYWSTVDL